MAKEITVIIHRNGRVSEAVGTVEELSNNYFSYTLECGASWEHERGNSKINRSPKTAKSLISNLNKAQDNSAANGYSSTRYSLK